MVNENIKQIIFNDELYSSIFDLKNIKEGLDFFTSDDAFIQVGTWNYQEGKILDVAQKLFEFSKQGLNNRNILARNKKYNETFYLKDLESNLSSGQSPADILIDKFNSKWNKDINKIYSEHIF